MDGGQVWLQGKRMLGDMEGGGSHGGFQQRKEVFSLICNMVPWLGVNTPGMRVEAIRIGDDELPPKEVKRSSQSSSGKYCEGATDRTHQ